MQDTTPMDTKKLRRDARLIFKAGIKAADPVLAVNRHLRLKNNKLTIQDRTYDLNKYEGIYVLGAGKASAAMAQALEKILGERIKSGWINVKYGHQLPLKKIEVHPAGHPLPDEEGIKGTQKMIQLLQKTTEKDLVIFLISGGGSALLTSPVQGITLKDLQNLTQKLLDCGATIHEINALRKHISQVKGGKLAQLAYPSTLISLVLSDVIGDNLDTIASGPTVPDPSTFKHCLQVVDKYNIENHIPRSILLYLERGEKGEIKETPKENNPIFIKTQNLIVGNNFQALKEATQKAGELGYKTLILSTFIQGETREIAKMHAALAKEILSSGNPLPAPACLLSGGETTVTVKGKGLGGRNQEFVLSAAIEIEGWERVVILSGGTDGTDGPTEASGAITDGNTVVRAKKLGLDPLYYLQQNDSYHFFKPLEDLLLTGPTFTNVMDLRLVMVG